MNNKLKGQAGGPNIAVPIVVIATALIIGLFVFATLSPLLSNIDRANETVGLWGNTRTGYTVSNQPIAPGSSVVVRNCTATDYGTCATMGAANYTINPDFTGITNLTSGWLVIAVDYTSGTLTATGQSTTATITPNPYPAFTLAAIVVIVLAAAVILRQLNLFG